jgi:hypothetical protein
MFANIFGIIGYVLLLTVKQNGSSTPHTSFPISLPLIFSQELNISQPTSVP